LIIAVNHKRQQTREARV